MAVLMKLYGSETWVLSKRDRGKISLPKMKFHRAVKVTHLQTELLTLT